MLKKILSILLQKHKVVHIIIILLLVGGFISYKYMIKATIPDINPGIVTVTVKYKNGSPDPKIVQENICTKLDRALLGVEGAKEIDTTAYYGKGEAVIKSYDGYNLNKLKDSVNTRIDSINDFPDNTYRPEVKIQPSEVHLMGVEVYGDIPRIQLKEIATSLNNKIERLPGVSSTKFGGYDQEIYIEIPQKKLKEYNTTFAQIRNVIKKNGFNVSSGILTTKSEMIQLKVIGRKSTVQQFRNIPVITEKTGTVVKLSQLAEISQVLSKPDDSFEYLENGDKDCTIDVNRAANKSAFDLSWEIKKIVAKENRKLPANAGITISYNSVPIIKNSLNFVYQNGIMGIIIVLIFLFLFLDFQVGLWVSLLIPVCLSGALIVLALTGCTINIISIFALFVVIGLVVDDGIVVGDSISHRKSEGDSKIDSVINGVLNIFPATSIGSIIMIIAFIPLLFIPGYNGQLLRPIPIAAIAALAFSLVQSVFILPVQLRNYETNVEYRHIVLNKLKNIQSCISNMLDKFIEKIYTPILKIILFFRYPVIALSICFLLAIAGLLISNRVVFSSSNLDNSDIGDIHLYVQPGTSLKATKALAGKITAAWKKVENSYKKKYGKSPTKFYRIWGDSSKVAYNIFLTPSTERYESKQQLYFALQKEIGSYPPEVINTSGSSGGSTISLNIYGENFTKLEAAADKIVEKLKSYKGIYDVGTNNKYGLKTIVMQLKPEAYRYNLSIDDITKQIKNGFNAGGEILKIQKGINEVPVNLTFRFKNGIDSVKYFNNMKIRAENGAEIPLLNMISYSFKYEPAEIHSHNGQMSISITANVNSELNNSNLIYSNLKKNLLPKIKGAYGVTFSREGAGKEAGEMYRSFLITIPVILLAIYFLLLLITNSYLLPLTVFMVIPFSTAGGIMGLALLGMPIFLPIGLIAVMGVIVNNAIVLLYQVSKNLKKGMPLEQSLISGGTRRFKAIFLTAMTTGLALLPIIFEKSFIGQLSKGISVQILFGLIIATFITLLLLPCFYLVLNDIRRIFHTLWYWKIPSRESIERNY
ncbi:MAG TPA: efflux RND transporter permease subunit [Victivallales bacterium]|nr:efflux RND transporter permease subunit [Victivallales bacterium]